MGGMGIFYNTHRVYKKLQNHLNSQPIGFPATITGVERRILQSFFTVDEAKTALFISYRFQAPGEILKKAAHLGITKKTLQKQLDNMEKNGALFVNVVQGEKHYAFAPFITGMIEQRISFMDANLYMNTRKYGYLGYGVEYLSTSHPQLRSIPVQSSVSPDMRISHYDDVRQRILDNDGHIAVIPCTCRVGMDALGKPCKATDRRETCLVLGDYADQFIRNDIGRALSREEALGVLAENEKDGLVPQTSNSKEAIYICSCCKCCCGPLEFISFLAKPAGFAKNNFHAVIDKATCQGCGTCAGQCAVEAIDTKDKKAVFIDVDRCLGCGICVTRCPSGALSLAKKSTEYTPPETFSSLLDEIGKDKKGLVGRWVMAGRRVLGF